MTAATRLLLTNAVGDLHCRHHSCPSARPQGVTVILDLAPQRAWSWRLQVSNTIHTHLRRGSWQSELCGACDCDQPP
jgi:hypothetical protein